MGRRTYVLAHTYKQAARWAKGKGLKYHELVYVTHSHQLAGLDQNSGDFVKLTGWIFGPMGKQPDWEITRMGRVEWRYEET